MSYVSTRRRRDRHIKREVEAIANSTAQQYWQQFCESINQSKWWKRLRVAWAVLRGQLA